MAGTLGGKERWVATGSIGALIGGMIVGEMLHRAGAPPPYLGSRLLVISSWCAR